MGAVNLLSALSKLPFHTDPPRLHVPPCGVLVPGLEYATLGSPHALHASSLPSLTGALRRHIPRWPIPQTAAGLLFGVWVNGN
jgi:hypothetical protein